MQEASETGLYPACFTSPKKTKPFAVKNTKAKVSLWGDFRLGPMAKEPYCADRGAQGRAQSRISRRDVPQGPAPEKTALPSARTFEGSPSYCIYPQKKGLVALPRALPSGLVQALGMPLPWSLLAHPTSSIYCNPSHLLGHLVYMPPHTHHLCWPREASFLRASFHEYHLSLA